MSGPTEAHYIHPDQLRIGLYIHLDLSWMDHPFSFSSFKIRNDGQIAQIRALKLARIRYSPERSDAEPAPALVPTVSTIVEAEAVGDTDAVPSADQRAVAPVGEDPAIQAKRDRAARLRARRDLFARCERDFMRVTHTVKLVAQNVINKPEWAKEETTVLVGSLVDKLLADGDMAVNLMADRIGGEDVYVHSLNVAVLSLMLAREQGMARDELVSLGLGAFFHDIGKLDVPPKVLLKQEPLTHAENLLLREHVVFGSKIGARIGLTPDVLAVVAQHHEHVDGSGYPRGATGERITLLAKIVAIANTYDNLCNPANPQRAMTPHEALALMYAQYRNRFEAAPLNTFIRCLGVYPPGTIVVLNNDAFGLVVSVNSSRPLKPDVLVYDAAIPKDDAIILSLEQEPEIQIARTLRPGQLPKTIFDYLSPRKRVAYFFDTPRPAASEPAAAST
ncbi:HD domain-containing phosphohydrolase [Niveibacterium sp.]|uniref:HD-GYP domain-containing protein n=1 Tax=Niveibacterium sp. TaxID=2017444 RepID=UPI0035B39962